MPAGYSGTPLPQKLGIKSGMHLFAFNSPEHYPRLLGELPPECIWLKTTEDRGADFVHAFFFSREQLEKHLPSLKALLKPKGMCWLSWPKKSSKLSTDLNREIIREAGLASGLVDVKVCAVDENWSGLKFVYRLIDRK